MPHPDFSATQVLGFAAQEWDRTALFIGAGLSRSSGLPGWGDFVTQIAAEAGLQRGSLDALAAPDQAEVAKEFIAGPRWRELLVQTFGRSAKPNSNHDAIARLPSPLILTTNYDTLIETALRDRYGDNVRAVIGYSGFRARYPGAQVVKIHGCVTAPQTMVVTRTDYDRAYGDRLLVELLRHVFNHYNVIFLGYSFNDTDLSHVLGTSSAELRLKDDLALPDRAIFVARDNALVLAKTSFRGLKVIPYEKHQAVTAFLSDLALAVSYHGPALRYRQVTVTRLHEWLREREAFRVTYTYAVEGSVGHVGIHSIGDAIATDTDDPQYKFNDVEKGELTFRCDSGQQARLEVHADANTIRWNVSTEKPFAVGERFSFSVTLSWTDEYPPWLEEFRASTLVHRPDGRRDDGRWSDAFFLSYPTGSLDLDVLFPEDYPVSWNAMDVGTALHVRPSPGQLGVGRQSMDTSQSATHRGVRVHFQEPTPGRSYGVAWRFPPRPTVS